jgi:hypothetical protein
VEDGAERIERRIEEILNGPLEDDPQIEDWQMSLSG